MDFSSKKKEEKANLIDSNIDNNYIFVYTTQYGLSFSLGLKRQPSVSIYSVTLFNNENKSPWN